MDPTQASRDLDYAGRAVWSEIMFCLFFFCCFLNVLKPVPINQQHQLFRRMLQYCFHFILDELVLQCL